MKTSSAKKLTVRIPARSIKVSIETDNVGKYCTCCGKKATAKNYLLQTAPNMARFSEMDPSFDSQAEALDYIKSNPNEDYNVINVASACASFPACGSN
jgi:predicted Zn-dependent protease